MWNHYDMLLCCVRVRAQPLEFGSVRRVIFARGFHSLDFIIASLSMYATSRYKWPWLVTSVITFNRWEKDGIKIHWPSITARLFDSRTKDTQIRFLMAIFFCPNELFIRYYRSCKLFPFLFKFYIWKRYKNKHIIYTPKKMY